jgi:hypothetical protein
MVVVMMMMVLVASAAEVEVEAVAVVAVDPTATRKDDEVMSLQTVAVQAKAEAQHVRALCRASGIEHCLATLCS